MREDTALVIIDTQVGIIEPGYRGQEVLDNIVTLLAGARASGMPVIYVQHDEPEGYPLEVNTPAWEIHPAIAPQEGEPVVHKRASDSFYDTTLQQELEARGIKHLIVVGGQTEYCVDTTVRRATIMGYDVTLVKDAHTTEDYDGAVLTAAQRIDYHNQILDGFGTGGHRIRVKPADEIVF
ncbi:MAG TPA: cysteine hydrolase family protein [Ktedonobacteraceae bacterium]|jgi:nicotinamidase-related amidase|nr:cysteine hydrolase family protein [Ktedonobacteraceae bacterium]